jgi:hypothetical protein
VSSCLFMCFSEIRAIFELTLAVAHVFLQEKKQRLVADHMLGMRDARAVNQLVQKLSAAGEPIKGRTLTVDEQKNRLNVLLFFYQQHYDAKVGVITSLLHCACFARACCNCSVLWFPCVFSAHVRMRVQEEEISITELVHTAAAALRCSPNALRELWNFACAHGKLPTLEQLEKRGNRSHKSTLTKTVIDILVDFIKDMTSKGIRVFLPMIMSHLQARGLNVRLVPCFPVL